MFQKFKQLRYGKFNYLTCECPRTEDGFEELQYDYGDVTVHGPEEERCPRKGGDESKYSKGITRERESMAIGKFSSLE